MRKLKKAMIAGAAVAGMAIVVSGCEMNLFGGGGGVHGGGGVVHTCYAGVNYGRKYMGRANNIHMARSRALQACRNHTPAYMNPSHCQVFHCN